MKRTRTFNGVVEVTTYYYYYDLEATDREEARLMARHRFKRGDKENEDIVKVEAFAYLEDE